MKFSKAKILIIIFLACINTTLKAQLKIMMPNIDVILLSDRNYDIEYYRQIGTEYKEIYLDEDEDDEGYYTYTQDTSDYRSYSWEQLVAKNLQLIRVENLPDISESDFKKKIAQYHWVVEDTSLKKEEKLFYMNMGENFLMRCQMELKNARRTNGFGVYEQKKNPDSVQWRETGIEYFQTAFIDFGKEKRLMVLIDSRANIEGIIQPKEDKLIFICEKYPIKATNLIEVEEQLRGAFYRYFPINRWYFMAQDIQTKKYGLKSSFKQTILPNQYDTLIYSRTFIITEKDSKVEIYRTNQEKVEIPNVIKAYSVQDMLEVLTPLGASYYDFNLKPIEKLPGLSYILCGTVSGTFYEISLYKKRYTSLEVRTSNMGDYEKKLILPLELPYKKVDSLHFLNGTKEAWWTENSVMTGRSYMNPELLRFRKRGKYGILEYDLLLSYYFEYNSSYVLNDTIKSRYRNEILYTPYLGEELTEVLPAKYNNIIFNEDNGLIYLYKNKKIGFYPHQIEPIYTQFEPKTNSFYAITREGKKGWIDIKKWKEYFWE